MSPYQQQRQMVDSSATIIFSTVAGSDYIRETRQIRNKNVFKEKHASCSSPDLKSPEDSESASTSKIDAISMEIQ